VVRVKAVRDGLVKAGVALAFVFGVFYILGGLQASGGGPGFQVSSVIGGVVIIAGLFLMRRWAGIGAALVVVGVLAMAALWYWLAVVIVPLTLLALWAVVMRARETGKGLV
jgi:hypothetical protein